MRIVSGGRFYPLPHSDFPTHATPNPTRQTKGSTFVKRKAPGVEPHRYTGTFNLPATLNVLQHKRLCLWRGVVYTGPHVQVGTI